MTSDEIVEALPLAAADTDNVRAVNVMVQIARARTRRKQGNPAPFWRAAGEHLARLRRSHTKTIFAEIVREHCNVGLSRAYELMALAGGKSLTELRAQAAERARRWRHGRMSRGRKRPNSPVVSET